MGDLFQPAAQRLVELLRGLLFHRGFLFLRIHFFSSNSLREKRLRRAGWSSAHETEVPPTCSRNRSASFHPPRSDRDNVRVPGSVPSSRIVHPDAFHCLPQS